MTMMQSRDDGGGCGGGRILPHNAAKFPASSLQSLCLSPVCLINNRFCILFQRQARRVGCVGTCALSVVLCFLL